MSNRDRGLRCDAASIDLKLWAIPTMSKDQPYILSIISDPLMIFEPKKEPSDWTVVTEDAGIASAEHLISGIPV
jgi:hypothetical protein